jgi:hypothetical protein
VYLREYGPTNFLYLCDIALGITLLAAWLESSLLASTAAAGIIFPQALWTVYLLLAISGVKDLGLTDYMLNPSIPLLIRGLSLYHVWLPILLVWMVWRLGYDRRAFWVWTIIAWADLVACYLWTPAPPPPADNPQLPANLNCVYGLSDHAPQHWMNPNLWFVLLLLVVAFVLTYPVHRLLHWLMRDATAVAAKPTGDAVTHAHASSHQA